MTFSCYGCGQEISLDNGQKFNLDNSQHICDNSKRKKSSFTNRAVSYTPNKPKVDTSARDAAIKEMHEAKQSLEKEKLEADKSNAVLISDSNNNVAIALNKVAEALHEYAQSVRFVKENTGKK